MIDFKANENLESGINNSKSESPSILQEGSNSLSPTPEAPKSDVESGFNFSEPMIVGIDGHGRLWGTYGLGDLEMKLPSEIASGAQIDGFTITKYELLAVKPELLEVFPDGLENIKCWRVITGEESVSAANRTETADFPAKAPNGAEAAVATGANNQIPGSDQPGVRIEDAVGTIAALLKRSGKGDFDAGALGDMAGKHFENAKK